MDRICPRGDPSHEGLGVWPRWDSDQRSTMVLGSGGGVVVDRPRDEELSAWWGRGSTHWRVGVVNARRRDVPTPVGCAPNHRGRSPTGRGRALKPPPVRVRIPPSPRNSTHEFVRVFGISRASCALRPLDVLGATLNNRCSVPWNPEPERWWSRDGLALALEHGQNSMLWSLVIEHCVSLGVHRVSGMSDVRARSGRRLVAPPVP